MSSVSEKIGYRVGYRVDRYRWDDLGLDPARSPADRVLELERVVIPGVDPTAVGLAAYDAVEGSNNLLMYGGASALWNRLVASSPSVTVFDNTNAYIGVGDSSTAAAATQTDLQAATNKSRKVMSATYPSHTDATTSGGASCIFKASWDTSSGNFAWNEWALFNASSSGRMFSRKVVSLGTKTSSDTWTLTITYTIA